MAVCSDWISSACGTRKPTSVGVKRGKGLGGISAVVCAIVYCICRSWYFGVFFFIGWPTLQKHGGENRRGRMCVVPYNFGSTPTSETCHPFEANTLYLVSTQRLKYTSFLFMVRAHLARPPQTRICGSLLYVATVWCSVQDGSFPAILRLLCRSRFDILFCPVDVAGGLFFSA